MNGLHFVRELSFERPMPMALPFDFRIVQVERGTVAATATPSEQHYNPFGIVQGGFAATVLDIALGLVSITVLEDDAISVATTDLSVRYIRSIRVEAGTLFIRANVVHAGRQTIVSEAFLESDEGKLLATSQSTSLIVREASSPLQSLV